MEVKLMEMSKLLVKDLMNGKFELVSDYIYQIENYVIKVPRGFITDYASIPRIFRPIVLPYGKHSGASVVHDYLYSKDCDLDIERKKADKIFLEILKEEGVNPILARLMYIAVRVFGKIRYKIKK
ncbi:hypothetical protein CTM92_06320 [Fusobacterium pseudoperiodonticum]|nr:hypothetical protein CTM92_06320 [Fusobacterium pseudoperiodonticum]